MKSSRTKTKTAISKITIENIFYFGLDYLRLNFGNIGDSKPKEKSMQVLESIFDTPHNYENTDRIENFAWGDSEQLVEIVFRSIDRGEVAEINVPNAPMAFRVIKISPKWAKNIGFKYSYQVECYGKFFHSYRLGILDIYDYLGVFINDKEVRTSVSRVDICVDITGIFPMEIRKAVVSKGNGKKWSYLGAKEKDLSDSETIYYGDKSYSNSHWLARIYNKVKDCIVKGKIQGYEKYLEEDVVSRLELEIRTDTCREYQISFPEILNKNVAWSVFYRLLYENKFTKWRIAKKLNTILKEQGFQKYEIFRRPLSKKALSKIQYFKRTTSMMTNVVDKFGYSGLLHLKSHILFIEEQQKALMGISLNSEKLEKIRNIGKISSSSII